MGSFWIDVCSLGLPQKIKGCNCTPFTPLMTTLWYIIRFHDCHRTNVSYESLPFKISWLIKGHASNTFTWSLPLVWGTYPVFALPNFFRENLNERPYCSRCLYVSKFLLDKNSLPWGSWQGNWSKFSFPQGWNTAAVASLSLLSRIWRT